MSRVSRNPATERRVLVLAPVGKDAPMTREILTANGVTADVCPDLQALCDEYRLGAGLLLVAEEALSPATLDQLAACVGGQPPWSDILTLIVLAGAATSRSVARFRVLPNATVFERPVRIPALVSTVQAALRARARQYELRDRLAELDEANRVKDEFLAMVSHELRTPLNVIQGVSQLMARKYADTAGLSSSIEKIDRNAAVLSRLVEDLLDLSRMRKGKFQLNLADVDLVPVVNRVVEMNRSAADARAISLVSEVDASGPLRIAGDGVRLVQAISNLVSNAIKFTGSGGRITVCVQGLGSAAEVVVRDTGIGIDAELLPHVFDSFRQGDQAGMVGLGLGLTIARQLIELHGGSIAVASPGRGQGTTFTIRLPLQQSGNPVAIPESARPS
jgi:signal transduction histidine kinase